MAPRRPEALPPEDREARRARLAEQVRGLPTEPGCYLMKDRSGEIFYIGKALNPGLECAAISPAVTRDSS
ncbi:MAG: hypothetical protein ACO3JL_08920, partial [Myxococcota bacterium]